MRHQAGRWPAELTVLRHAESAANAAFAAAAAAGLAETCLTGRDADIPLSAVGQAQAAAIGRWLADQPPERVPEVVVCSPYRRAVETLRTALAELRRQGHATPPVETDQRLRDRETGVLELLTPAAVRERFPAEDERRRRVGELLYRPAGGESLADVGRRVRDLLDELAERYPDRRVMLVAHDAVVLMLRCVIDNLPPADFLRLTTAGPVRNASITRWVRQHGRLQLRDYDHVPGHRTDQQEVAIA